jgi:hypothetical protein
MCEFLTKRNRYKSSTEKIGFVLGHDYTKKACDWTGNVFWFCLCGFYFMFLVTSYYCAVYKSGFVFQNANVRIFVIGHGHWTRVEVEGFVVRKPDERRCFHASFISSIEDFGGITIHDPLGPLKLIDGDTVFLMEMRIAYFSCGYR